MNNREEGVKQLVDVFNCINSIPPLHTEIEYLEDFLIEYIKNLIKTSSKRIYLNVQHNKEKNRNGQDLSKVLLYCIQV